MWALFSPTMSKLLGKNTLAQAIGEGKLTEGKWEVMKDPRIQNIEFDGDIRYLNRLISILALEIWIKIFICC